MDEAQNIIYTNKPKLRRAQMVCGIEGWVNGGESATGTTKYLINKLRAEKFAEIPINRFHIFQVPGQLSLRPHVRIENGMLQEHRFPTNQFFYWVNPNEEGDLILFLGSEPNLNWEEYAAAILSVAESLTVDTIYWLGGVLDKIPYTKEPNVLCTSSSDKLKQEMQKYGVQFTNYEGPGSFGTTLLHICRKADVQMLILIAKAAYYPEFNIVIPHSPKCIRALARRLNGIFRLNLDVSDLDTEAEQFEEKLDFMANQNPELRIYIDKLEKEYVEINYEEPLNISADEAVRMAEDLLRGEEGQSS